MATRKRMREALERRRDHLAARVKAAPAGAVLSWDAAERDALTWALEREAALHAMEAAAATGRLERLGGAIYALASEPTPPAEAQAEDGISEATRHEWHGDGVGYITGPAPVADPSGNTGGENGRA